MRGNIISMRGAEVPLRRRGMLPLEGMGQDDLSWEDYYSFDPTVADTSASAPVYSDTSEWDLWVAQGALTPDEAAFAQDLGFTNPADWYDFSGGGGISSSGFDISALPFPTLTDTAMLSEQQPMAFVSEADSGWPGGILIDSNTGQLYSATSGAALVGPPSSVQAIASQVVRQAQQQRAAAASSGGSSGAPSGGAKAGTPTPLPQATLPAAKLPTAPSWWGQQTILAGVPNWAIVAGGALAVFIFITPPDDTYKGRYAIREKATGRELWSAPASSFRPRKRR